MSSEERESVSSAHYGSLPAELFIEDENEYLGLTDLVAVTEGEPDIVVLAYSGSARGYSD